MGAWLHFAAWQCNLSRLDHHEAVQPGTFYKQNSFKNWQSNSPRSHLFLKSEFQAECHSFSQCRSRNYIRVIYIATIAACSFCCLHEIIDENSLSFSNGQDLRRSAFCSNGNSTRFIRNKLLEVRRSHTKPPSETLDLWFQTIHFEWIIVGSTRSL